MIVLYFQFIIIIHVFTGFLVCGKGVYIVYQIFLYSFVIS